MAGAMLKGQQQVPSSVPPFAPIQLDQDVSPFLGADMVPPDVTPRSHYRLAQQPQQPQPQYSKSSGAARKQPGGAFARLFCCTAPAVHEEVEHAVIDIKAAGLAASPLPAMRSQHSWSKVYADNDVKLVARASSEYYDACSTLSDITPQHSLERASPAPAGVLEHQQQQRRGVDQQQTPAAPQERPHWVPPQPLLFAPPGLNFVPVPAVTGFAGVWECIHERCTPHPQPIDVMNNASALVRKIHESVPGIVIEEDGRWIKMIAQPSFLPKGLPAAHVETYDKTHATSPSWLPRRDVKLGTGHGHVYFTAEGMLIIRHEPWGLMARQPDYIVEDYLTLEEGGSVVVDRMCCHNVKTGSRAEQVQVVRLVSRPGGKAA